MNAKQLQVWKVLEEYSDLPDVLRTLLLKFVGSYEWSNIGHIPYDVTCECMLYMNIEVSGAMVLGNIKKLNLLNCKVGVIRTKGIKEDEFTLKCIIGGIPRTFTPGIMSIHIVPDRMWFITGRFCGMIINR